MQSFFSQLLNRQFITIGLLPMLAWLLGYATIYWLLRRQSTKNSRLQNQANNWVRSLFLFWQHSRWFIFLLALYPPLAFYFPQLKEGFSLFGKVLTSPLFGKGSGPSLISLSLLLPIFFLASRLAEGVVKLLELNLEHSRRLRKRLYKNNIQALLTISHYVLLLLFCLFGINLVGINLSSLSVILGALGLGVGFGLQNMAANFVSGITLLLNGHIQCGDFIRTPNAFGTVERIGLMSTIVLTTEYENLIIPNQYLLNEIIENASYNKNRTVQLHLPLGVSYESDLDHVLKLIKQIILRNPYLPERGPQISCPAETIDSQQDSAISLKDSDGPTATEKASYQQSQEFVSFQELGVGNDVWLKAFGASSIDFEVRIMIENIDVYRAATHWFYMEVWRVFRDHGITIPFAQMDIHLHSHEGEKSRSVRGFQN